MEKQRIITTVHDDEMLQRIFTGLMFRCYICK